MRKIGYMIALSFAVSLLFCGCMGQSAPTPEQDDAEQETVQEEKLNAGDAVRPADEMIDFSTKIEMQTDDPANDPPDKMAHNIYSDPDLTGMSGRYSGFLIDFCAQDAPISTYWALCNWSMKIDDPEGGMILSGGDAYAGLQHTEDGMKAIMSFWETQYVDQFGTERIITAERVYPSDGPTNRFDGEGEGTNYITDYPWQEGSWYRMYLCCYEDAASGHTFVEQWVKDISAGTWSKISCFDTGLSNAYFEGPMSQFMENYISDDAAVRRSFEYCNLYIRDFDSGEWTPIQASILSVDTWWGNKKGNFAFGATEHTLWGTTIGYGADVAQLDEDISQRYTIAVYVEPDVPDGAGA